MLHLQRYIAKYVYKSKLKKRRITLPMVYCRPFASKAVFRAILKDSEVSVFVFFKPLLRQKDDSIAQPR